MLVIYRGRFALSASFYLHFIYLSKQHKCNAFPKQTKVEKGMDRYRALPLLTCEHARLKGPRTRSITTYTNLDCAFFENARVFIVLNIRRALAPPWLDPHAQIIESKPNFFSVTVALDRLFLMLNWPLRSCTATVWTS